MEQAVEVPRENLGVEMDPETCAKQKAEKLILEAERFKATVNPPPGILDNAHFDQGFVRDDDEFFHITCHVDPNTIAKIRKGEFIDLERLLPCARGQLDSEPRSELVFREGRPVIVPHVDRGRISSIHKWEQAFRVYAAIYSQANPARGPEIWQYVYTINHAAGTYAWNNVAEYDFTFRQMMAVNLASKWSKIYQQMWTMCMTDPHRGGQGAGGHNHQINAQGQSGNNAPGSNNKNRSTKSDFCWKYNKGCCKFGSDCKFVHKCSYCDSTSHGMSSCPTKATAQPKQSN